MNAGHRFRGSPWCLATAGLLTLAACDCGASHQKGDAATDGPMDATGDTAVRQDTAVPDVPRDTSSLPDGSLVPFPAGWDRVPFLPTWCNAWRPIGDAVSAVRPIGFEPCVPAAAGCDQLVINQRSTLDNLALLGGAGDQTWAPSPILSLSTATRLDVPAGGIAEYWDSGLYRLDGTPVAVWRLASPPAGRLRCFMMSSAVTDTGAALAFKTSPGSTSGFPWEVFLVDGPLDRIQHVDVPRFQLGVAELWSDGNGPRELLYDGTNLIMQGSLGAVYFGTLGSRPFEPLAACVQTGDSMNTMGFLFDGAFYFNGSPCEVPGWARIRRRLPGATMNETLMERIDGSLGSFRTDGRWAVWVHHVDDGPIDAIPDRTDILAARTGGVVDPATWTPRVLASFPIPNLINGLSRPVLAAGMYAYLASWDLLEVIDLEGSMKLSVPTPRGVQFINIRYLGPDYVIVVYSDGQSNYDGLRRYHFATTSGWAPL